MQDNFTAATMSEPVNFDKPESRSVRRMKGFAGPIAEVRKHTPNRKCINQIVSKDGQTVSYLHVTKGYRVRKLQGEPHIATFWQLMERAHKFKASQNA